MNVVLPRLWFKFGIRRFFSVYLMFVDKSCYSCTVRLVVPRPTPQFIYCECVCVFLSLYLSSCCRSFEFSLISRTYRILSRDRSKRTEVTGLIRMTTSKRPRGGDSRGQRPKVARLEIGFARVAVS